MPINNCYVKKEEHRMEIVAPLIAGIFALLAAYLGWRLRESEKRNLILAEKLKEKEELYKRIHKTFDYGIKAIREHKGQSVEEKFIELNAEVMLLAPKELSELYHKCCLLLEGWSALYVKAWPNNGLIMAPDPTAKYKEPEKAAYSEFWEQLQKLIELMKNDLAKNT